MAIIGYLIVALFGYLLGSIPTGYLVGLTRGVDIRTVGSKNMGATNVFRTLGKGPGIFVLLMDALKGFAAVSLVTHCHPACSQALPHLFPPTADAQWQNHFNPSLAAGIAAVLGHNYTCWLKFKGGKGIATTGGVFLALAPAAVGIAAVCWFLALLATRYVSIASIVAAITLPCGVWLTRDNMALRVIVIALGVLAIYKHRANLARLRAGTENRFNFKSAKPPK
ncbi:MAG: glycerol-3-phosphate 1-O-acyltransferase PlsY [Verrucomicrobiae bacterium]|nr:glycerol-3-phosphate 1-O-acyltransferase PlsY [Verrucomicrobiae bacterium]